MHQPRTGPKHRHVEDRRRATTCWVNDHTNEPTDVDPAVATDWHRTDRLLMRPWRADEAPRLFDIKRRPEVTAWLGDPEPWTSVDQASASIERIATFAEPPRVSLAIVPHGSGTPVGTILMSSLPGGDEVEIGWFLHPDSMGYGWATEAGRAIHDRAVAIGVTRVWAGMWPHNEPSAGVCRRIGMADLGVLIDPWYGTAQYPLSRLFCTWPDHIGHDSLEHPLNVLATIRACTPLQDSDVVPPVGANGAQYPG